LNIQNVDGLPIKIKDIFWKSPRKNSIGEVSEYPELAVLRKEQKEISITIPKDLSAHQLE
jgi:hypothetical protein